MICVTTVFATVLAVRFKTRSILFGSEHQQAKDTALSRSWMAT
jgi:hypothetical protein